MRRSGMKEPDRFFQPSNRDFMSHRQGAHRCCPAAPPERDEPFVMRVGRIFR